ncbi:hypothetical protein BKP37_08965 [Anaerobacillus alkalilacustris]|uniref:Uncharacterized protein n=1 Tax=Anaerobacillus alkalilacustris TaxID=393763 RepID=A0A1S2LPC5_9BACI|nr:hypothetical protein [Anaerobacillus alkalilacustris]OIJ14204.1 hypothetical protein BKP37_08965 [Anaerobacillus alkalilacustris]
MNKTRQLLNIGIAIMLISATLSFIGLSWDGLYQDENLLILKGWWINDWVTLVVAVPLFAIAIILTKKGGLSGVALLSGLMMYTVYNYSYYLFGAAFNAAFIGYVIVFVLGLFGLLVGGVTLFSKLSVAHMPSLKICKFISIYMGLTALLLSIGWIGQWLRFVTTGITPALLEQLDITNHLVAALDMTLVVPWFLFGSVLLWKKQVAGLIVGFFVHVKTVIYTIILLWGSTSQMLTGIEDAGALIPLWGFFFSGSLISISLLLKPIIGSKIN